MNFFSTNVQEATLARSFFVERKFNHLTDDNRDALWYDKNTRKGVPMLIRDLSLQFDIRLLPDPKGVKW